MEGAPDTSLLEKIIPAIVAGMAERNEVREAALAGLLATLVAGGITWASFGVSPGGLFLGALLALPAAALGGGMGVGKRRP